jgi:methionyl-tRNA formyltransferase
MKMQAIDFFLSGYKGLQVLKSVCKSDRKSMVANVIAADDRQLPDDSFEEIKTLCGKHGIPFHSRKSYKSAGTSKFSFFIGWRWIGKSGPHNIILHDSILPTYRGFAPLVSALIQGEDYIGATAFYATDNYDSGPIIKQKSLAVLHPIRMKQALEIVSGMYIEIVDDLLGALERGEIPPSVPQDETNASYSLWRDEQDYFIDWSRSSEVVLRTIYALSEPYLGAKTFLNGQVVIVDDAALVDDVHIVNRTPGKVIFIHDGQPVIVCGVGLLRISSAREEVTNKPVIPLTKFRNRFGR